MNKFFLNIQDILKGTIILFLFLIYNQRSASQNYLLSIHYEKNDKDLIKSYHKGFRDTSELYIELRKQINKLIAKGYQAASIDSTVIDSNEVNAYCFIGECYSVKSLIVYKEDTVDVLYSYTYRNLISGKRIIEDLNNSYEDLILKYENTGYPFAYIKPFKIEFEDSLINVSGILVKGDEYKVNDLIIKGTDRISESFIKGYLSIKKNSVYNEEKISQLNQKLQLLNFISTLKAPEIEFYDHKVDIYLYLGEKKSNLFSGILGIIPQSGVDLKMKFAGEVNINLVNVIKQGENLILNWNALSDKSQKLNASFSLPYMINTALGSEIGFKLAKIDTSFIITNLKFGLSYNFGFRDRVSAYLLKTGSYLLNKSILDTALFSDSESLLYGLSYQVNKTDYFLNPRKGYDLNFDFAIGNRSATSQTETVSRINFHFESYISFIKNITLKLATSNRYIISNSVLYENELMRIGGFNEIRGFDEDFFTADGYSGLTIEMRYNFARESNFFTFIDAARLQRKLQTAVKQAVPIGIGFGTNFATKAGILSISYGLGKIQGETFKLSNSKIHIGYINRF